MATSCSKSTSGPSRAPGAPWPGRRSGDRPRPAEEALVELHVLLPVEADVRERQLDQPLHRVALAGGDDVVVRLRPAAASATSPARSRRRSPSRAARRGCRAAAVSASPSLMRATPSVTLRVTNSRPRRGDSWLKRMPEHGEQVVALAVVDRDVVAEHLRHAVGAARVERRQSRSAAPRAPCRTSRSTTPGRSGSSGRRWRIASSTRVTPCALNSPVSIG